VTATVYTADLTRLDEIQDELYQHLLADPAGRCTTCAETEPCHRRDELGQALVRYGRLPRRRPGFTRAGMRRMGTGSADRPRVG